MVSMRFFTVLIISMLGFWGCDMSESEDEGDAGAGVTVEIAGQSVDISIGDLTVEEVEGFKTVNLGALVDLGLSNSGTAAVRSDYVYDFESSDGFRPSAKGCEPLLGETLDLGYLNIDSNNLFWKEEAGLPGCYAVRDVKKILAIDPDDLEDTDNDTGTDSDLKPKNPISVTVKYNAASAKVDLGNVDYFAEGTDVLALLTDVVAASELADAPENLLLEPEADGFKPSDKECDPLAYVDWKTGRINVDTGDISWPDGQSIAGCYKVGGATTINLYDR